MSCPDSENSLMPDSGRAESRAGGNRISSVQDQVVQILTNNAWTNNTSLQVKLNALVSSPAPFTRLHGLL